jgi:hypothetical protein
VPFAPSPDALETKDQDAKPEPTAQEMAELAKELQAAARADGRTLSATDAVARARRELIKS